MKTSKHSIRKAGLVSAILLLLFACEKNVILDLAPHTPVLVVHGYLAVGDTVVIAVGKSTNSTEIRSDEDTYVNNATVVLYEDGVIKDTLIYNDIEFRYTSSIEPVSGKTYRIVVEAPGFRTVEATSLAPSHVNTQLLAYVKNARTDMDGVLLSDVKFRVTDPVTERNYYLAKIESQRNTFFCVYTYDAAIEQYQGSANPFETSNCIGNNEVLFTDNLFNGASRDITISADAWSLDDTGGGGTYSCLKKYHVSKEFYDYMKDGIVFDVSQGNPFAEPIIMQGNVRNGYGLFTVYTVTVDTLK